MDNKTIMETFTVLNQLEHEKGFPIKFEYGLVRNITRLKVVVEAFQKLQTLKVRGQEEFEEARVELLVWEAKKDDNGKPVTRRTPNGQTEYVMENHEVFDAKFTVLKEKFSSTIALMEKRNNELTTLLDEDVDDFQPYMINVKNIPVDKDGMCKLSILQLRFLMPFLDGDIEDLPDCA